jgi:hypothetical protein
MNILRVPAVCAVFLPSHGAYGRLTCGARLVDHPIFELVSAYSVSDDRNFLLGQSDWLAASGTDVTAHRFLGLHHPLQVPSVSSLEIKAKDSSSISDESLQVSSIVFCESSPLSSSE